MHTYTVTHTHKHTHTSWVYIHTWYTQIFVCIQLLSYACMHASRRHDGTYMHMCVKFVRCCHAFIWYHCVHCKSQHLETDFTIQLVLSSATSQNATQNGPTLRVVSPCPFLIIWKTSKTREERFWLMGGRSNASSND